ncbi:hypothetical protein P389DRAFT_90331 [Cystobasidium minutum MCA 4210]|uniref:uncharacterized protein n=1 Tax=Cystobasidium minutum MCA 4210 TaxID=1397322 RepID=UPI0034CE3619|eukprot:jgi/Rhomi1/90331/CE90330_1459
MEQAALAASAPAQQTLNMQASTTSPQQTGQNAAQPAIPKRPGKKRIRIQTEKRKEQNRSNQRAFRQRRERYVKDLEVSHHNLRQLVVHQGGEIESLKGRLVDLTGGKEGTEPSIPLADSDILGNCSLRGPSEASPSGTLDSGEDSPRSEDDNQGYPSSVSSTRSNLPLPPVEQTVPAPKPSSAPSSTLHNLPPARQQSQPATAPPSLPLAISIPKATTNDGVAPAPQYWSMPGSAGLDAESPSPRTFSCPSSSTASSFASSGPWTPPNAPSTFQPVVQSQPYLTMEPAAGALQSSPGPYHAWKPETPGHLNDFSQWLQHSMQGSQYCLPYQDRRSDGNVMPGRDLDAGMGHSGYSTFPSAGWPSQNNALGLDNLFPNLSTESRPFNATDPLHLLGRPLTPFPSLQSPAEYTFMA